MNTPKKDLLKAIETELEVLQMLDGERSGSTALTQHTWFVDHHLGRLKDDLDPEKISALEQYMGREMLREITYPLTPRAKPASKISEQIKRQDFTWCEHAIDTIKYRNTHGNWPPLIPNIAQYRQKFDEERALPNPRNHILMSEISEHTAKLGQWLNNQRAAFRAGKMREDRAALLATLEPKWYKPERGRTSFLQSLDDVQNFVRRTGRWPKRASAAQKVATASSNDFELETRLANVLYGWRQRARNGTLSEAHETQIRAALGDNWQDIHTAPQ